MLARIGSSVLAVIVAIATLAPASASTNGSATVKWYATDVVDMSLTPNYATGYGTVKAVFGTQPTPAPGGAACYQSCAVDFGPVLGGTDYLYKYAAHINVQTNDPSGFTLYGEGAADFYNNTDGTSQFLNQSVYYLPSTSGGTDSNTGFSASLPFYKTSSTSVTQGSLALGSPGTISYTSCTRANSSGCPSSYIASSASAIADLYYDYQLKVPSAATGGTYYVWIVYTVVAK